MSIKKLILVLFISLQSTLVFANTANPTAGWSWGAGARSGATSSYSGKFTDTAGKVWNGVAKIKPSAKDLGKFIGKFGAAAVVTTAVDIVLDGVDYVMDPANNTITYYEKGYYAQYGWYWAGYPRYFPSVSLACNAYLSVKDVKQYHPTRVDYVVKGKSATCYYYDDNSRLLTLVTVGYVSNPAYDREKEKKIGFDSVGQKIIDLAESGDLKAGALVGEVADSMTGEIVGQFEDTKAPAVPDVLPDTGEKTGEATGEKTGTDTQNPPKDADLPAFCSWATHVCNFIDWVKDEPRLPESEPYKIPIQDANDLANSNINRNYYNASVQCPSSTQISLGYGVIEISYQPICDFFIKISPLVVAISYIIGAFIIAGRR